MSFIEFLCALGHKPLANAIINQDVREPIGEPIHGKALDFWGEYVALGGMPEVVQKEITRRGK